MEKELKIKYIEQKQWSWSRKIPIVIHKYDYKKEFLKDFSRLDESNKWDLFFLIFDNLLTLILENLFYYSYKINFFLFVLIGEYREKLWYKKINSVNFQKKFTDSELEEFALLIWKDFTDSQIKDCISLKKWILINSWRQIQNIKDYRKKLVWSR